MTGLGTRTAAPSAPRPGGRRLGPGAAAQAVRLPGLVWLVLAATLAANALPGQVLGYSVSGYAWLVPLLAAGLALLRCQFRVSLSVLLWVPWAAVVLGYLADATAPNAFQRSVMLLCPLVIGAAVSAYRVPERSLARFFELMPWFTAALWGVVVLRTGLLATGVLPTHGMGAVTAISATLPAAMFASLYACGALRALPYWLMVAVMPVLLLTRMAMLATAVTLPGTLAPLRLRVRVLALAALLAVGLALFNTPRFQARMFYSGEGTLEEVNLQNPDFASSGRKRIWRLLEDEIAKKPWLGHGANSSEALLQAVFPGLEHPHNDWLRLRYDYGYAGTGVFALCLVLQAGHAYWRSRHARGATRVMFLAAASSFIPFAMVMYSDNVILYAAFFGNLHFTMLGLAYSAQRAAATATRAAKTTAARETRRTGVGHAA